MVCKTNKTSLHLLAETPNAKTPRELLLFSNDRFLVAVDQSCNKVKVINNVYHVWNSVKLHHDISNLHLPDAILSQRDAAIANRTERNLCLLLSQANVNTLELSDGCLTSELLFSVNLMTADLTDVVLFGLMKTSLQLPLQMGSI